MNFEFFFKKSGYLGNRINDTDQIFVLVHAWNLPVSLRGWAGQSNYHIVGRNSAAEGESTGYELLTTLSIDPYPPYRSDRKYNRHVSTAFPCVLPLILLNSSSSLSIVGATNFPYHQIISTASFSISPTDYIF